MSVGRAENKVRNFPIRHLGAGRAAPPPHPPSRRSYYSLSTFPSLHRIRLQAASKKEMKAWLCARARII